MLDLNDPVLAPYLGMRDPVIRNELNCFVAEGLDILRQAIDAGFEIVSALVDARHPAPVGLPASCAVLPIEPKEFAAHTGLGVLRNVVALVRRPEVHPAGEVLKLAKRVVVLEAVENPVNVGLIARSAAALGFDAIVTDLTTADPLYRRAVTSSRGAVMHMPWVRVDRPLHELVDWTTVALTPNDEAPDLRSLSLRDRERVAIVVGSEGPGLTEAVMTQCTYQARIPMHRAIDSLNVATATAIACWEVAGK